MKHVAIGLWAAQLLAAACLLIGALIHIESILVTGPILTLVGLMLAIVTRGMHSWIILSFAVSAPLVCAFIATLIAVFDMPPDTARLPVLVLFSVYVLAQAIGAAPTIVQLLRWQQLAGTQPVPFRFSLKTLLIAMTAICLLVVLGRMLFSKFGLLGPPAETYIFGGFALVAVLGSGFVVLRTVATGQGSKDA